MDAQQHMLPFNAPDASKKKRSESSDEVAADASSNAAPPAGHSVMWWVLTSLAVLVFAPCVLLPVWQQTQEIKRYELQVEAVVASLQSQLAQNRSKLQAFQADPLVVDRMARRELNVRTDAEAVVRWSPPPRTPATLTSTFKPVLPPPMEDAFADLPTWARTAQSWLPNWPWTKLFAESPNRTLLLAMATGLLAAAFFLYGNTSRKKIAG